MLDYSQNHVDYDMQVPAALSILGSSLMIISYLTYPKIRQFKYFEIIFIVAINDLLASIGLMLGDVPSGSVACWIQGIVTNYNFLVSIAYTTFLSFELYMVILYQIKVESYLYIHIFCWGFPLFPTFLPLSTNNYGKIDDDESWCFLANRSNSPSWGDPVWTLLGFYVWIWLAILCVSYMYIAIQLKLRRSKAMAHEPSNERFPVIVNSLSLYPILLIICWSCTTTVGVFVSFSSSRDAVLKSWTGGLIFDTLGTILPALQGFFHSIIFISRSQIVRQEWMRFIRQRICCVDVSSDVDEGVVSPFQIDSSFYGTESDSQLSRDRTISSLSVGRGLSMRTQRLVEKSQVTSQSDSSFFEEFS
jgi:hypothetical protein